MASIEIIAIGKDKDTWVTDGAAHYEKLLKKYCAIYWKFVNASKLSSSLSPAEIKSKEAVLLEKHLDDDFFIALSDSGKSFDSRGFAKELERILSQRGSKLKIVIGGPYGLDESILKKANMILSLSSLTFSHQVVRLVLLEQLFRAFSILNNTDYHK